MKEGFWDCYWGVWGKTFTYQGCASRKEFWTFVLANALLLVAVIVATISLGIARYSGFEALIWSGVNSISMCGIAFLLLFLPVLAVGIRRMHDIGISGWWFGGFILINIVIPAILLGSIFLNCSYEVKNMIANTYEIVSMSSVVIVYWLCTQPSKTITPPLMPE